MAIADLLESRLVSHAGVAAIVGTRVYPQLLPGNNPTLPAITYRRVSNTGQDGTSTLRLSRWQIDCWAKRREGAHGYEESQELAWAVKAALEDWHNMSESPGVLGGRVVNEIDDYDPDAKVYRTIIDVMLHTDND